MRSWILCPYRQHRNVALLQQAQIPRISAGSKCDLVMVFSVLGTRFALLGVLPTRLKTRCGWLSLLCWFVGFTVAELQFWPSRTGFCLLWWGYLWSLSRSVCGFQPYSFPLISFLYPVGCISLGDRHPIKTKLLGVLAFEKHVTLNVLVLLKCGLSSCLSFSVRCQRIKAGVPIAKNRKELSSWELKNTGLSVSLSFKMLLLPKWSKTFSAFFLSAPALIPMEGDDVLGWCYVDRWLCKQIWPASYNTNYLHVKT